ncbi:MAG: hypothetical protein GEU96_21670 [Propionibacteriales bacterium]|nr:hypothetical protein [Propionibacteriales bacterium]
MSPHEPMDELETEISRALHAQADQVRPSGDGLARIRARTARSARVTRQRRTWLFAGAAGLATAGVVVGGLVIAGDLTGGDGGPDRAVDRPAAVETSTPAEPVTSPSVEPTRDPETPTEAPTTSGEATTAAPQPKAVTVPVYYLGDSTRGPRLFREFHAIRTTEPAAQAALNQMLDQQPFDPDYTSPWPKDSRALGVADQDDLITVDLSRHVLRTDVSEEQAELMLQQLVYTVQAARQNNHDVQLTVEGEPAEEFSGVQVDEPLTRGDPLSYQAMTWITAPVEGQTVGRTLKVEGIANHFEANVSWELVQDGEVVRDNFTTAAEGMTFTPYSFTLTKLEPGDYTVRVFESSPEDGSVTFLDTKTFTVE